MINVLVVEDSITVGMYLEMIINLQQDMKVIGRVSNGKEAVRFCRQHSPDVITMDIEMPVMNGLEATKRIMAFQPVPIVIITASFNTREANLTMQALEAGAVTLIEKPRGLGSAKSSAQVDELVNIIRLMSEVKVVTRRLPDSQSPDPYPAIDISDDSMDNVKIVAVGVSTGGPSALKQILSLLDRSFPLPLVIVQHIAVGFLAGMVNWLNNSLNIPVRIAEHQEKIMPGNVYFAPDQFQIAINSDYTVNLTPCQNENICPSVSYLFDSIHNSFGKDAMAILLTGMGRDGAKELKILHNAGAVTVAQDRDSALVYGMPKEAVKLGAARYVLNTNEIGTMLKQIACLNNKFQKGSTKI